MRIVIQEVATYEFTRDVDELATEMKLSVEEMNNLSDEELWDTINNTWPICESIWRNVAVEEQEITIHRDEATPSRHSPTTKDSAPTHH